MYMYQQRDTAPNDFFTLAPTTDAPRFGDWRGCLNAAHSEYPDAVSNVRCRYYRVGTGVQPVLVRWNCAYDRRGVRGLLVSAVRHQPQRCLCEQRLVHHDDCFGRCPKLHACAEGLQKQYKSKKLRKIVHTCHNSSI